MDLRNDPVFVRLLAGSYQRLVGKPLVPADFSDEAAANWLYRDAPFGILAHDTAPDPVFIYGNIPAQEIFEYDWEELTKLPSRLSAVPAERSERQRFLEQVIRDGYVADYSGERVTKSNKRFWIESATVWQLMDEHGSIQGQAAMIPRVNGV